MNNPLRVLVCGSDRVALALIAQMLSDDGVKVKTSTSPYRTDLVEWDVLLVDLERSANDLRRLLPAVRRQFPNLQVVGISTEPTIDINFLDDSLELDDYLFRLPRPEDLITCFPRLAANYLCDADPT